MIQNSKKNFFNTFIIIEGRLTMKVLKNSVANISFRGLVPKKSYNGPLLNLTDADKAKIAALQENINQMELELYDLNRIYGSKRLTTEKLNYVYSREEKLNLKIEELQEIIKTIKMNRIKKQVKE